jgi:hypothetical protein
MMSKLWTPPQAGPEVLPEPKCPASRISKYADSGRPVAYCGVERKHFPVADAPKAVLMWCCDNYGECPVWQAEKNHDPVIDRVHEAQDDAAAKKAEKGYRAVDPQQEALEELRHEIEQEKSKQRLRKLNEED